MGDGRSPHMKREGVIVGEREKGGAGKGFDARCGICVALW